MALSKLSDNSQPRIFQQGDVVKVHVFAPLDLAFDYRVGEDAVHVGDAVEVPFGTKSRKGVVWGEGVESDKLKTISKRLSFPAMHTPMREFLETMAQYTITPMGQVLPMAYRAAEPLTPKPNALRVVEGFSGELSPKRQAIYDQLCENGILPINEIDASRAVLNGMVKDGAAQFVVIKSAPRKTEPSKALTLSDEQRGAVDAIKDATKPVVLKGITGSGKTEVYLAIVAQMLEQGKQSLVLLPEIALTAAFLERFETRFGLKAGHWHSEMTQADRRKIWHGVASGDIPVVIGARSALFLPFESLGFIVVDEEHDRGYKQDEGVVYNGRDMAVLRGHFEDAKVVLASATPSIETMLNAQSERYERVDLAERFGKAELPDMRVVDMRDAALDARHWISPMVVQAMRERIERNEQSLLFLNRRGFAPLTLCRACGHQMACPNCDARLVEHRHWGGLHCHQCGYQTPIPKACPECEAEDKLVPIGPGVERLADEVREHLPDARICILSSDLVGGEEQLKAELAAIESGAYDIIIGTQMVAKGHNFPELTLVGIIDADIGLEGGDLRAAEQSFQVLRQVSGRAGRFEKPGLALVQTYQPEHPILRAILSQDDQRFYEEEIARRRHASAPPFSRYVAVIIWASELDEAMTIGRQLLQNSQPLLEKNITVWGPVLAPISRIRGRTRVRMLLKMPKSMALHAEISQWINSVKTPARVKMQIDVDPQSFL